MSANWDGKGSGKGQDRPEDDPFGDVKVVTDLFYIRDEVPGGVMFQTRRRGRLSSPDG